MEFEDLITGEIDYDVKLRGFTIDGNTCSHINFHSFEKVVNDFNNFMSPSISVDYVQFRPCIRGGVVSKNITKRYKPVFSKGWIDSKDGRTLYPFGYCHSS